MSEFDAIRPYEDGEVRLVIDRLLDDRELLDSIVKFKLPGAGRYIAPVVRSLVRRRLSKRFAAIRSVLDFQKLLERYMKNMLDKTVDTLSITGLENLDATRAHLFISNHRDIAMDPAFVNWALYQNGFSTLRIAIGDNLLTKPFASDLMRLNKCFIVNRSATAPREKLKAAKLLSRYVHHSVVVDNENVWIAQREGRAKDGVDQTNPAIISMLLLNRSKQQTIQDYVKQLQIVPVSISYEYDPCDESKAKEIYEKVTVGEYTKGEHEDVRSIAQGIIGYKGKVHLSFGAPIGENILDADSILREIDRQIVDNYVLHSSNCIAYELLEKAPPKVPVGVSGKLYCDMDIDEERKKFLARMEHSHKRHRETFLRCYANPVYKRLAITP